MERAAAVAAAARSSTLDARQTRYMPMFLHKSETVLPAKFGGAEDPTAIDRALDHLRAAAGHCNYSVTQVEDGTLRIRSPLPSAKMRSFRLERERDAPVRLSGTKLDGEVTISINSDGHRLVCRWRQDQWGIVWTVAFCAVVIGLSIRGNAWGPICGSIVLGLTWWEARSTDEWVKTALEWRGPSGSVELPSTGPT